MSQPAQTLKSGEKPHLALDAESNCDFHVFFSHVWKSGQGKSDAIAIKMQLIMAEIRLWLNADEIYNYDGDLEKTVNDSAVFILFLSKGYFGSSAADERSIQLCV